VTACLVVTGQANRTGESPADRLLRRLQPNVQSSGCPSGEGAIAPAEALGPNDFVEVRRTQCFGTCPAYTVRVRGDGQIAWQGENFVQLKGAASGRVDPREALLMIGKFRAAGMWSLCEKYDRNITDVPTTITTVHIGAQERVVFDRANGAPDWLRDLGREVDALADTHRWIHGDPQIETFVSLGAEDARGPKPLVTPLMQAVGNQDLGQVQKLLAAKANPNAQDSSGWTALIYAAVAPRPDMVKALLDAGADPNLRSYTGQTAIMAASKTPASPEGQLRRLIEARGDVNAQDKDGQTALMFAVDQFERADLVSFLLTAGARVDLRDSEGRTVMDRLELEAKRRPSQKADYEELRRLLRP
jgi:hypothetical protein